MLRKCMTFVLMALLVFVSFEGFAQTKAKTNKAKKSKSRSSYVYSKKSGKNKKVKNKKNKKGKGKRYKRSGNGPDLRALTTEKADSEYTDVPDNGVNSVETKTGL